MEEKRKDPTIYYKGSCACKRITYDSFAWPSQPTICHCRTCRKLAGAAYQVYVHGDTKSFIFYDNKESLRYEGLPKDSIGGIKYLIMAPFAKRAYCESCNTPLAMVYKHEPDETAVTVGSVDEESFAAGVAEAMKPIQHIFVSQKVWWLNIDGDGIEKKLDRMSERFEAKIADWEASNA